MDETLVEEPIVDEQLEAPVEEVVEEDNTLLDEATGLPEEMLDSILTTIKYYENEDKPAREVMTAFWRKLDLYFQGIQRIFYDFQATDWKRLDYLDDYDPNLYDKIINIYRGHGESLISALSIKLPNVIFYPDDADVNEDIETAEAYTRISELVTKHNEGILLFMKALHILYNQGVACAYIYNRASKDYGTVKVPQYGSDVSIKTYSANCPMCNGQIHEEQTKNNDMPPQFPEMMGCETCQAEVPPNIEVTEEVLPQIVGYTDEPKSKTIIDIYGPLYVQMAFYARKQEQLPYLFLKFEQHESLLRATYEKSRDKIGKATQKDLYERSTRAYAPAVDDYTNHLLTVGCRWIRPWAFECLGEQERAKIDELKTKFPKGCYVTTVGDVIVDVRSESLDEHWEITHHPLSTHIHADPMGKPLMPVQELRNEATDLAIETFEHSIPETFADNLVLDFEKYKEEEAKPGSIYPVKAQMGKSIGESFFSTKTATLNEEIESFLKRLDADGQFAVGSFPSIYGGPATTGSKTASEYAQSRAQALQRLNVTWTMLKHWWARVMGRAVVCFANGMVEDEKYVDQSKQSETRFINIWIRQSELTGKIGRVEPDANEELPTSFTQMKQIFTELLTLNNPEINLALFHPQNTGLLAKVVGVPQLYIPGADSRNKQYAEIAELLKSGPIGDGIPTIPINPETDIHDIEAEALLAYMNSSAGQMQKKMNPLGYANCEAHFMLHKMVIAERLAAQKQEEKETLEAERENSGKPSPDKTAKGKENEAA